MLLWALWFPSDLQHWTWWKGLKLCAGIFGNEEKIENRQWNNVCHYPAIFLSIIRLELCYNVPSPVHLSQSIVPVFLDCFFLLVKSAIQMCMMRTNKKYYWATKSAIQNTIKTYDNTRQEREQIKWEMETFGSDYVFSYVFRCVCVCLVGGGGLLRENSPDTEMHSGGSGAGQDSWIQAGFFVWMYFVHFTVLLLFHSL